MSMSVRWTGRENGGQVLIRCVGFPWVLVEEAEGAGRRCGCGE
jgi:hypothetical protein